MLQLLGVRRERRPRVTYTNGLRICHTSSPNLQPTNISSTCRSVSFIMMDGTVQYAVDI